MKRHDPQLEWPRLSWPINEILLQALVLEGKKDDEIAALYYVPARQVTERREDLGI